MHELKNGISLSDTVLLSESTGLDPRYPGWLDRMVAAGFTTLRLPIGWGDHLTPSGRTVRPEFVQIVDDLLGEASARFDDIVITWHHFTALFEQPAEHLASWAAVWEDLAAHWRGALPQLSLALALLNEPRGAMTPRLWNEHLPLALKSVRNSDPRRTVILGPAAQHHHAALADLVLPADPHLLLSIHYYEPFTFTHQGASWLPGANTWRGVTWPSGPQGADQIRADLVSAAQWAHSRGLRLFVGEFGSYERADLISRVAWTTTVRQVLDDLDVGWAYWDFAGDFGVFDPRTDQWHLELLTALACG